jgi:peptidoglycan/LPS O-acetylase OafA/YrhL
VKLVRYRPTRWDGAVTDQASPKASAPADRLTALDGLRIVAAVGIVVLHVSGATGQLYNTWYGGGFNMMSVGVAIFFVLSGFVVFRPWVQAAAAGSPAPDAVRFLVRRFTRIVPAAWVLIAAAMIFLSDGRVPFASWARWFAFVAIYTPRYAPGVGQVWTLCVELTFYLLLPLLAALVVGRRRPDEPWRPMRTITWIAAITVPVTLLWLVGLHVGLLDRGVHTQWLPSYLVWFGAGMILCVGHVALQQGVAAGPLRLLERIGAHPWVCWGTTLVFAAIASTHLTGPRFVMAPSAWQFTTRIVVHLAISVTVIIPLVFGPGNPVRALLASRPMRYLGGSLSYGVYLWHPFVLLMIYQLTGWPILHGQLIQMLVLTILGALALAAVSHHLIEEPLMRLAARLLGRRRGARTAESQPIPDTHPAVDGAVAAATTGDI